MRAEEGRRGEVAVGGIGRQDPGEQLQPFAGVDRVVDPDDRSGSAGQSPSPSRARVRPAARALAREYVGGSDMAAASVGRPRSGRRARDLWATAAPVDGGRVDDHRQLAQRHAARARPRGHDHGGATGGRTPRVASGGVSSLFDVPVDDGGAPAVDPRAPLAVRMRPRSLDEVVGQQHLLGPRSPLRRLVEADEPMSVVLYGPPGTGKTTLAHVVSLATQRQFVQLSALDAGVKEVRAVIADAKRELTYAGRRTVLFIDEVHRFSKTQQDSLLSAVEDRIVSLVAATTENPYFSVVSPLLSRSLRARPAAAGGRRRARPCCTAR